MNRHAKHTPVGVCIFPAPRPNAARTISTPGYVREILGHAGLCHEEIELEELASRLSSLRVLLTVGETALPEKLCEKLRSWVEAGGAWVSIAGVCGLSELFGVTVDQVKYSGWGVGVPTLGEGYAIPSPVGHPVVGGFDQPLHFFNGLSVLPDTADVLATVADAHQRPTPRAAITEFRPKAGHTLLISVDIPGTVVRVQQGVGVTRDGIPAPDGTAPNCDDVLKSGDGGVLDWLFDRDPLIGIDGLSGYLRPVADLWREVLLRSLFHLANSRSLALPLLWYYPRNLPALAHMSHDTDSNEHQKGVQLFDTLDRAQIRTTWCTILPGYEPDLMRRISTAGHELAMHYDAMSDGLPWGEQQFDRQWKELTALFDGVPPVTNKNHYLRWEGDCDLFRWCIDRGIKLDQSKGASKAGEVGYNFGTCHLYFPITMDAEFLDILEMPTPTQDFEVFVAAAALDSLLNTVMRHSGILHLLFHPAHIDKPGVADAIVGSAEKARRLGLEWWTARQINDWERARRTVRWSGHQESGDHTEVTLEGEETLRDATVLWLLAEGDDSTDAVTRHGFRFRAEVLDLVSGVPTRVRNEQRRGRSAKGEKAAST